VTVNYRALPELTYYAKHYPAAANSCPVAMRWGEETISLPLYPGLPLDQQDHVIRVLSDTVASILR
jgi:dTDP-4-amino-4,6-dideoxygalactose transaminase